MSKYHPKKELAPRDIVARANYCEMKNNNISNVYLNATVIEENKLLKRFPTIAKKCLEYGIDITKKYIPVAPAAHYFMGGVKTNLKGETSIEGLYAVGEVSSTGLHGGNRLASNSLLECVVCAYEIAESFKNNITDQNNYFDEYIKKYDKHLKKYENLTELRNELKKTMWENVGIFRNETTLKIALNKIRELKTKFGREDICATGEEYEFRNMITTAELVILSALTRKESRGAHYRTDYPETNETCKHSIINNKNNIRRNDYVS